MMTTAVTVGLVLTMKMMMMRKEEEVGGGERDAGRHFLMILLRLNSEREERYIAIYSMFLVW